MKNFPKVGKSCGNYKKNHNNLDMRNSTRRGIGDLFHLKSLSKLQTTRISLKE